MRDEVNESKNEDEEKIRQEQVETLEALVLEFEEKVFEKLKGEMRRNCLRSTMNNYRRIFDLRCVLWWLSF